MKIIFSPTKKMTQSKNNELFTPKFEGKTNELLETLKKMTPLELEKIMKIKNKTLENVVEIYQGIDSAPTEKAINSYNGISFKQLELDKYSDENLEFLESHLVILSALYGVLKPNDYIKEYRLDMNMKIFKDESLYNFWKKELDNYFKGEDLIINLASKEFSKLINYPMLNLDFKENKDDIYKSVSSYSKKARGMMLNYIIYNNITDIKDIKAFNLDGYTLNEKLSEKDNLIFTR